MRTIHRQAKHHHDIWHHTLPFSFNQRMPNTCKRLCSSFFNLPPWQTSCCFPLYVTIFSPNISDSAPFSTRSSHNNHLPFLLLNQVALQSVQPFSLTNSTHHCNTSTRKLSMPHTKHIPKHTNVFSLRWLHNLSKASARPTQPSPVRSQGQDVCMLPVHTYVWSCHPAARGNVSVLSSSAEEILSSSAGKMLFQDDGKIIFLKNHLPIRFPQTSIFEFQSEAPQLCQTMDVAKASPVTWHAL